jgi:hypothetical protein
MSDSTRHKWGKRVPLQNRTERHCTRCGLVRVTRHEPNERPWIEWERDGARVNSELTPMCDGRFDAAGRAVKGTPLLHVLALGGKTGMKLADVIVGVVRQGAPLGSLDPVECEQPHGSIKEAVAFPPALLDRIQRALDVGAFDRLTAQEIIERLLLPPLAEAAE